MPARADVYAGKFTAKDRSEGGCMLRLAKDLIALIKWDSAVQLEDKVYFLRNKSETSSLHVYTVYAKGKKELEKAQFKLTFSARWTDPACVMEQAWGVKFFDQANRNISFQNNENDQTVTEYKKFLYPPVEAANTAFLAERGYDDHAVLEAKVVNPAVLKQDIKVGLGTLVVGSVAATVPVTSASSLGRKLVKRVVAPALIIDGAVRVYDANQGNEASTIAIVGPVSRISVFGPDKKREGVLRLPESYENQLDEKADEKKK